MGNRISVSTNLVPILMSMMAGSLKCCKRSSISIKSEWKLRNMTWSNDNDDGWSLNSAQLFFQLYWARLTLLYLPNADGLIYGSENAGKESWSGRHFEFVEWSTQRSSILL